MHGLVNKAVETFVSRTYGVEVWRKSVAAAGLKEPSFEAMMEYDDDITPRIIDCAVDELGTDRSDFLINLGIFLVSNSYGHRIRRLLRFGGVSFIDFLYSLDDLHDRAKLAVPDLDLPILELREHTSSQFSVTLRAPLSGFGYVLVGLLTAMADDYGSLVMMEHGGRAGDVETIAIALLDTAFTDGNSFQLGAGT